MRILVIGGAGYIGSHTVLELLADGHQPVIVDNFDNSNRGVLARLEELAGAALPFYEGDFRDSQWLRSVIDDEKVEGVIHFAAHKAVGESVADPLKYYGNNTAGFTALLQTLVGAGVRHVIFSSTAAVYGNTTSDAITEETACRPESPYGWSKYMDEIILRDTCVAIEGLNGTALRYFNVVGAHGSGRIGEQARTRPQNLLPIIIQAATGATPPLTVLGDDYPTPDGTCQRDYIHVTDLARAHVAALGKSVTSNGGFQAYNIGTGTPTSVLDLIRTFERTTGVTAPHSIGQRRAGDPAVSFASPAKAERELGWNATKTIEDACRDAWRWQNDNPKGYDQA